MHLIYIDDSYEKPYTIYSAIAIPAVVWRDVFGALKGWRREINASDGIFVNKELHATDFVAGRGRLGPDVVTKHRRSQIFLGALKLLNRTDGIRIFNICLADNQNYAFERLPNRINRTMKAWDSQFILFCDEGNEGEYTRLVRKMAVHNPIPSRYGAWIDTGRPTRNIPTDRILEDLFFKNSEKLYFIQMADFCAYALLRREKHLASKNKYGILKAFDELTDVVVKPASPHDPMGVIR